MRGDLLLSCRLQARRVAGGGSSGFPIRCPAVRWPVIERLMNEWRACQQRVDNLERQYAEAMLAYCRGEGPPPSDQTKERIAALRNDAKELLARAIAEIDRAVTAGSCSAARRRAAPTPAVSLILASLFRSRSPAFGCRGDRVTGVAGVCVVVEVHAFDERR